NKKIILAGIGIILLAIVIYGIVKLATFELFDNKMVEIAEIPVISKDYSLIFYRFTSSATIQGSIQVNIKYRNGNEKLLKNYNRYNKLIRADIYKDSTMMFVLQDTLQHNFRKDTFYLT